VTLGAEDSPSSADDQKRAAGEAAARLVEDRMTVGLGTGTTAAWFVKALADRRLAVTCVATSEATASLAQSLGMAIVDLDDAGAVDLTVDGADELDSQLRLIKGGGAALLREKLVWRASARCIVIADESKQVETLGKCPLPIEVVTFGHKTTARRVAAVLASFGVDAPPLLRTKDGLAVSTDSGNVIYDARCEAIAEPSALGEALKAITGVVEHGLFLNLAAQAFIGTTAGVRAIRPKGN
jgi:ribose 5-phosphate isomerase A